MKNEKVGGEGDGREVEVEGGAEVRNMLMEEGGGAVGED